MNNEKYIRAKELRAKCEAHCELLKELLPEVQKDMEEFYNLMRWENLGCSSEEYEVLYEGFIYPYEENSFAYHLDEVISFCNTETRNN